MSQGKPIQCNRQLWTGVANSGFKAILDALNLIKPDNKWSVKRGHILGRCVNPDHLDINPSMAFSPTRGFVKCFSCGYAEASLSDFFKDLTRDKAAFPEFITGLGIRLSNRYRNSLFENHELKVIRSTVGRAMNFLLQDALINYYDEEYAYCRRAIELIISRRIPANLSVLSGLSLGIFPNKYHLFKYLTEGTGIWSPDNEGQKYSFDRVLELLGGTQHFSSDPGYVSPHTGWVAFPYYVDFRTIGGFKLRNPTEKQFSWVGHIDPTVPQPVEGAVDVKSPRGLYGLNQCGRVLQFAKEGAVSSSEIHDNRVYIKEGEFDVISCQIAQAREFGASYNSRAFVGASGGGLDSSLDYLKDCGIKYVSVLGDYDHGGEEFVTHVLEATSIPAVVFDWTATESLKDLLAKGVDTKGLDPDTVVTNGLGSMFLRDIGNPNCWKSPVDWFLDSTSALRKRLRDTRVSGESDREIDIKAIDAYAGALTQLQDSERQEIFTSLKAEEYATAAVSRAFVHGRDDDEAIIRMLEFAMGEHLKPLMREGGIYYFCKLTDTEIVELEPSKPATHVANSIELVLANITGCHLVEWARQLELPKRVFFKEKKLKDVTIYQDRSLLEIRKSLDSYVKSAVIHMCKSSTCPPVFNLDQNGAGFYYYGWKNTSADSSKHVYIVNGRSVYKGAFPLTTHPPATPDQKDPYAYTNNTTGVSDPLVKTVTYTKMNIPTENGVLFNIEGRQWSDLDIDSLNTRYEALTPRELFDQLVNILNIGWSFIPEKDLKLNDRINQDLTCRYLAAWIMSSAVLTLFETRNQTYITAEPSSGKTTLLESLISAKGELALLDSSEFYSEYTVAAVLQGVTNRAVPLLLDEFEAATVGNKTRGVVARALLEAFRANYKGEVTSVRGTKEQKQRKRSFSASCLFAGINPPFADSADRSRWIILNLVREAGRAGPIDLVRDVYSKEDITTIKQGLNNMLPQRAHEILEAYRWCKRHKTVFHTPSDCASRDRFTSLMLPIYSILRWVGQDVKEFSRLFALIQEATTTSNVAQEDFKSLIFTTPCKALQPRPQEDSTHPNWIAAHLRDSDGRYKLNESYMGAYYYDVYSVVVLYLPHIRIRVLKESEFIISASLTNTVLLRKLREQGAWQYNRSQASGICPWLEEQISLGVNPEDFAVFDMHEILGDSWRPKSVDYIGKPRAVIEVSATPPARKVSKGPLKRGRPSRKTTKEDAIAKLNQIDNWEI